MIASTALHKKMFSVDEANNALVLVRMIVRDILQKKDVFFELQSEIELLEKFYAELTDEDMNTFRKITKLREQLQWISEAISYHITELTSIGCLLQDFSNGMIDFPALHSGREVYLCWQFGEDSVHYWHELDGGFSGRQILDRRSKTR